MVKKVSLKVKLNYMRWTKYFVKGYFRYWDGVNKVNLKDKKWNWGVKRMWGEKSRLWGVNSRILTIIGENVGRSRSTAMFSCRHHCVKNSLTILLQKWPASLIGSWFWTEDEGGRCCGALIWFIKSGALFFTKNRAG